jgi:nucleotide-binding universal stress UspA family protein
VERCEPGRIVVGIGRSSGAYQALRYAVAEARRRGAPLLAVRAFAANSAGQSVFPSAVSNAAAMRQIDMAFTEALGGRPPDVRVEIRVCQGAAPRILVSAADRENDLLVIGGCGVRRWIGRRNTAIARFCAQQATCPVVIVPPTVLARSGQADHLARDVARTAENLLCQEGLRR